MKKKLDPLSQFPVDIKILPVIYTSYVVSNVGGYWLR